MISNFLFCHTCSGHRHWLCCCFLRGIRYLLKTAAHAAMLFQSPTDALTNATCCQPENVCFQTCRQRNMKIQVYPSLNSTLFYFSINSGLGNPTCTHLTFTQNSKASIETRYGTCSFPGGKAAGEWSWPLTSITAAFKNEWSYTSAAICPHDVTWDKFTFNSLPWLTYIRRFLNFKHNSLT